MHEKTCKTCQQSKFLRDFYEHPHMADQRLSICIECKKAAERARYRTHPEVRARVLGRAKKKRAALKRDRERSRQYRARLRAARRDRAILAVRRRFE